MMRSLLDVNVLIALLDEDHAFHHRAHLWYGENRYFGWASCPLTENGLVRIMSNINYHPTKKLSVEVVAEALKTFIHDSDHVFWQDDISLTDSTLFDARKILGPRQLTDIYLLALASRNGGQLVTFDENIPLAAVLNSSAADLQIIP